MQLENCLYVINFVALTGYVTAKSWQLSQKRHSYLYVVTETQSEVHGNRAGGYQFDEIDEASKNEYIRRSH